jgi:hypothetical protein
VNDSTEFWIVEQFVDLGNETFWHEKARFFRKKFHSEAYILKNCHLVGERDVVKHGGRYRIRVVKEETWFDSGENE